MRLLELFHQVKGFSEFYPRRVSSSIQFGPIDDGLPERGQGVFILEQGEDGGNKCLDLLQGPQVFA